MRNRIIAMSDLADAGTYFVLLIVGWLLPPRASWFAVKPLAILHSRLLHRSTLESGWLPHALAHTSYNGTARRFDIDRLRTTYHEISVVLRLLIPAFRLPVKLVGQEHIDAALENGKGVILLVGNTAYSDFAAKAAIGSAGIPIAHLSIPGHGSSGTWFGRNFITRPRVSVENRYVQERIVMNRDTTIQALKSLERRLRKNGVVSITGVSGASSVPIPFLGGNIQLGRAAPALSRRTDAVVLPVFTTPSASGHFTVQIGAPLNGAGKGPEFELSLATEFGRLLEVFVREHPTIWPGWQQWEYTDTADR